MIEVDGGLGGVGTTMRVTLPAAQRPAPEERPARRELPRTGEGAVLVVDDDVIVRRALATTVDSLGYRAIPAASGTEAVALLQQHRAEVRAVLLDMVMPGMSGRATYLALREVEPEVRVVLMSGFTLNEDIQEILDLGVRAFLSKPYTLEALASLLATLTAR
jgi:CheY-like chemotaxis protein